jgi:hypothetical protein
MTDDETLIAAVARIRAYGPDFAASFPETMRLAATAQYECGKAADASGEPRRWDRPDD